MIYSRLGRLKLAFVAALSFLIDKVGAIALEIFLIILGAITGGKVSLKL